jgi:hypothetical protein
MTAIVAPGSTPAIAGAAPSTSRVRVGTHAGELRDSLLAGTAHVQG